MRAQSTFPTSTQTAAPAAGDARYPAPRAAAASAAPGRLSATLAHVRPKASDAPRAVNADRPKILFLDDEERILNALGALFRYKYQVFTATTGEQALAILRQYHVHVVVSDQRMPAMTGVDFLRQAKDVSPKTVRILLTGFSDLSAIIDSVNDGEVYRFLNKPWGNQEIQAVIADALAIGVALEQGEPVSDASAADAAVDPAAGPRSPAVLMLHDSRETFDRVRPLLSDTTHCVHVSTLDECLEALQREQVGVVVSSLQIGNGDASELLKVLKQEHPQILTIVLAHTADANHVIDLINQAKIFRYVLAPCKPQKLKFFIESALTQFQRYRGCPALLRQQKPEIAQGPVSRSQSLLRDRLRSLRSLFARNVPAGR